MQFLSNDSNWNTTASNSQFTRDAVTLNHAYQLNCNYCCCCQNSGNILPLLIFLFFQGTHDPRINRTYESIVLKMANLRKRFYRWKKRIIIIIIIIIVLIKQVFILHYNKKTLKGACNDLTVFTTKKSGPITTLPDPP